MPVPLLVGLGIATAVAGFATQMNASSRMASAQKDEIAQQQAIEAQRKKQMELEAHRQQLQILRQSQRARAVSLATATNQGAAFGSALQGAYSGESGATNSQLVASNQNLEIGTNIFGYNSQLSNDRIAYAGAQSNYATGQGLTSLGGALISNASTLNSGFNSAKSSFTNAMSFGTGPGSYGSNNSFRTS